MYNAEGFFGPNDRNAYSVNNVTAVVNDDGSVTVHFGSCEKDRPDCLPLTDGWNYTVRVYRPRPEILEAAGLLRRSRRRSRTADRRFRGEAIVPTDAVDAVAKDELR